MHIGIQTIKGLLTLRLRQRNCAQEPVKTNRPQPTSLLCTLPIELIEYIAAELDLVDLCLLRLACKNLSQKTLHYFGSTYFAYVLTDLSPISLQKLQQLSQHELIGHYVRTLLIKGPHGVGRGFSWERSPSQSLIFPHTGVQTLQDALLALENCRSFYIYNDRSSPRKLYDHGCLRPSDIVAIVLYIIAETSLPVRSFMADFFAFGETSVEINRLHLADYQKLEFKNGWSQLQNLFLRQSTMCLYSDWVQNLIAAAPNLRCLSLDFGSEWMNTFFDKAASWEKLPKLQELNISSVNFHNDSLFDVLFRFGDSLRILRLAHFSLDMTRTWKSTFKLLRAKLLALETISVFRLSEWIWIERNGLRKPCRETVTFPGFLGVPSVSGLEQSSPFWLDGWKVFDYLDHETCGGCFPGIPNHSRVLGQKYTKFIVTKDRSGPKKKEMVFGVSYSGANIGDVLDLLAESATPLFPRH
ncbi:hypothetical protein NA56DRAFT_753194 [Hyaloscypha hepaticicola]|uniref:F-box domain-containing protein n=1 Tax=Hyaloscypha hepaticicola TaxID=2082293 RepID=A0A2J6PQP6_9HELO|nr:hypothetical protein NA56DRAFT_753194 [Hyaloscypha hepaticicola]